ncbi:MAG TPA: hypothetical protein VIJ68_04550 [Candidatus Saccharimonadales bacterium]
MSFYEENGPDIAAVPTAAQREACYQYLAERAVRPDFVMVQIGHSGLSVADQQAPWRGERRYFGAVAWLQDENVNIQPPNPNVQFLSLNLGGEPKGDEEQAEQEAAESWYSGPYDFSVPLSDGIAHEVFFGDVIGDSRVTDSTKRTPLLLAEASRLLSPGGHVVIRETISPGRALKSLTTEVLAKAGLKSMLRLHWGDPLWSQLEESYDGQTTSWFPKKENFYQLLTKTAGEQE